MALLNGRSCSYVFEGNRQGFACLLLLEEIDLAMKIEAGVAATEELEKAEEEGIELGTPRTPPP